MAKVSHSWKLAGVTALAVFTSCDSSSTQQHRATSHVTIKGNLSATAPIRGPWDPERAEETESYETSLTLYDSLGHSHSVRVCFCRNTTGPWDWHAMTDGAGLAGGTAGLLTEIAGGTLQFDGSGRLMAVVQASHFDPLGAANPQELAFDLGDQTSTGGTGVGGLTQYGGSSAITYIGQDGSP